MPVHRVKLTGPNGTATGVASPAVLKCTKTVNMPATCNGTLAGNYERYSDESSSGNACQGNGLIEWTRDGARIFTGRTLVKTDNLAAGNPQITLEATDLFGLLNNCLAVDGSGNPIFTLETTATGTLSAEAIFPVGTSGGLELKWYPAYTSGAARSGAATPPGTVLDVGGITSGSTSATMGIPDDNRLPPSGLARIGSEVLYYDGYDLKATGAAMIAHNMVRGCLGTTAAAHAGGASFFSLQYNGFVYAQPLVEGSPDGGATWITLDPAAYTVNYAEGSISFAVDPLVTGPTPMVAPATDLRITADYYDLAHAGATALCLANPSGGRTGVLETLLSGAVTAGGPGLSSGDWDIDLSYAAVQRLATSGAQNLRNVIATLVAQLGPTLIGKDNGVWPVYDIAMFVDHSSGKLCLHELKQDPNNPVRLTGCAGKTRRFALSDTYSMVCVNYTVGGDPRCCVVALSNLDPASNPNTSLLVYDLAAYNKLFPSHGLPQPRALIIDGGECGPGVAAHLGQVALRKGLTQYEARTYNLSGFVGTIPEVGTVVDMEDGFEGVLWSVAFELAGGAETITATVVDFTGGVP